MSNVYVIVFALAACAKIAFIAGKAPRPLPSVNLQIKEPQFTRLIENLRNLK